MKYSSEHAVVQLFVQTAIFDWLEPYKPPRQISTFGTGFFIDGDGHVLTSFHVISEAVAIQAQVPSLGKERFDLIVVGIYPDRDIALLELTPAAKERFLTFVEQIPYVLLGESDRVKRGESVLALGYPLGQETLKITQGVVSGYQEMDGEVFLQVTAPLNPGNSGGPCVNEIGQVVGVNTSIIQEAQNIGYVVPISDVKAVIKAMYSVKIVHRPVLGCDFNYSSSIMRTYLGNPEPGGIYINRVFKQTSFSEAGICPGDMIYKINHHELDVFGDTNVSWSDEKIHFTGLLHRFDIGQQIDILYYRYGERCEKKITFNMQKPLPIRLMFPEFEKIEFEILGGMVVMPLTFNHIGVFEEHRSDLGKYCLRDNQYEGRLVISNIFQNSPAQQARVLEAGDIIALVNNKTVHTIEDFCKAVEADKNFLSVTTEGGHFSVLSLPGALNEEMRLAEQYRYQPTPLYGRLAKKPE
jgi:S1-C subfamily serine protease